LRKIKAKKKKKFKMETHVIGREKYKKGCFCIEKNDIVRVLAQRQDGWWYGAVASKSAKKRTMMRNQKSEENERKRGRRNRRGRRENKENGDDVVLGWFPCWCVKPIEIAKVIQTESRRIEAPDCCLLRTQSSSSDDDDEYENELDVTTLEASVAVDFVHWPQISAYPIQMGAPSIDVIVGTCDDSDSDDDTGDY
jgi:hypothetical protein